MKTQTRRIASSVRLISIRGRGLPACPYSRLGTFPNDREPVVPGGPLHPFIEEIYWSRSRILSPHGETFQTGTPHSFFSFGRDATFNEYPALTSCPASYSARLKLTVSNLARCYPHEGRDRENSCTNLVISGSHSPEGEHAEHSNAENAELIPYLHSFKTHTIT